MVLDIKEGDYLVVGGKEYPIKSCAEWAWSYGQLMRRLLKVTASTKRRQVAKLTGVRCTPLDPVSSDIRERPDLQTPNELLQTFADGGDVFYELVLEDLNR